VEPNEPERVGDPPPKGSATSEDGVDLTLIRWFLGLTPAERLSYLEEFASAILEMRNVSTRL
jgi:hypothetical protein